MKPYQRAHTKAKKQRKLEIVALEEKSKRTGILVRPLPNPKFIAKKSRT